MYFRSTMRINPNNGVFSGYYRLIESYRDAVGEVRKKTLLTPGFLDDLSADELCLIQTRLNQKVIGTESTLFSAFDSEKVRAYIDKFYAQMISEKKIDALNYKKLDADKLVYSDSINNKDVREVGAEWLSLQAIEQLKIDTFLRAKGWSEAQVIRKLLELQIHKN